MMVFFCFLGCSANLEKHLPPEQEEVCPTPWNNMEIGESIALPSNGIDEVERPYAEAMAADLLDTEKMYKQHLAHIDLFEGHRGS